MALPYMGNVGPHPDYRHGESNVYMNTFSYTHYIYIESKLNKITSKYLFVDSRKLPFYMYMYMYMYFPEVISQCRYYFSRTVQ